MPDLSSEQVLRWGHARARFRARRQLDVPPWLEALDREYNRRRMALRPTAGTAL